MKNLIRLSAFLLLLFVVGGCMSVKSCEKMYVNDSEMELGPKKVESFETNFETYREGAAGANGGKVGGGCGCN